MSGEHNQENKEPTSPRYKEESDATSGEKREPQEFSKEPGFCSATCVSKAQLQAEINSPPKTSDYFTTCNLPKKFEYPHWFNGYGSQVSKQHPFYRTTSSEYGWYPPGIHSVPSVFFGDKRKFSEKLSSAGMYRNYSLNMSAPDPPVRLC